MKISLIMPRGALYRHKTGVFHRAIRYAPLTLTTLASLVPSEVDAEIQIIDEGISTIPNTIDADLVGITAITGTALRAYTIADRIRNQGIPVVLGGVHPTLMPDEAQQHADAIVTGFAEESWPQLLNDFQLKKMKKRYTQSAQMSLTGLPIPRRDLFYPERKGFVSIDTIQATRGCTNSCDFCVVPVAWGKRMYLRPIHEVIAELEGIPSQDILFVDVSPIEDRQYAKELYRAMIPLKKRWVSPMTLRITDDNELLGLAAKSGCRGLLIGFESVSQQTLSGMRKSFNHINRYKDQVDKLHDHGIAIQACFVFGFDTDDESVFERTVELADRLKLDLPRYTVYTPFPGTPIFRKLQDEHRIIEERWAFYDAQHVVFKPKLMSPERLQEGHWQAWKDSYSLLSMIKRLAGSRCLLKYMIPANIAYRFYGDRIPTFTPELMLA